MSGTVLSPAVVKEFRALLPTWFASAAAIVMAAFIQEAGYSRLPSFAYAIGMLALGAQSIGHEYTHRTLGGLLSLPTTRHRLLLNKLAVLFSMLLMLSALAWLMLFRDPGFVRVARFDLRVLVGAAVASFFLAPWLTMICRSTLAGVVFTIVVPALLLIAGDLIGLTIYGSAGAAQIDEFKLAFLWRGLFLVCAFAAFSTWRMFGRLEAIEGRGADVETPRWLGGEVAALPRLRRHHPYWALVKKELRLQQLTFVVVIIFAGTWATLTALARLTNHLPLIPIDSVAVLYFAILTILIGSLASAEERQLGTLEWQLLLPAAGWKQWIVKVGVVFGLVFVLGILLPGIAFGPHVLRDTRAWMTFAAFITLVTTISVYVSSLSTSGVRAMVMTLPVTLGVVWLFNFLTWLASRVLTVQGPRTVPMWRTDTVAGAAVFTGFVALALWYAYLNHRSAEFRLQRVLLQSGTLAGYVAVTFALTMLS
jgi:ABC-type transport system involved in multi-copper enzyme maturation permease subunit